MRDLRDLLDELVATPLVPTPPVEHVRQRAAVYRTRRRWRAAAAATLSIVAIAAVTVASTGREGASDRLRTADHPTTTIDSKVISGAPPPDSGRSAGTGTAATPSSLRSPVTLVPTTGVEAPRPATAAASATEPCPRGERTLSGKASAATGCGCGPLVAQ